jgi:hypothetical protein
MRVYVTLSKEDGRLAKAYADDRGLPLGSLARSALMADVRRTINRSHLREAVLETLKDWVIQNARAIVREGQSGPVAGWQPSDALAGRRARAEGVIKG